MNFFSVHESYSQFAPPNAVTLETGFRAGMFKKSTSDLTDALLSIHIPSYVDNARATEPT